MTRGFEDLWSATPNYGPYDHQDLWAKKHPTFPGYNCRITAFGLFRQRLRFADVDLGALGRRAIFLDRESLTADPSALVRPGDLTRFTRMYSAVRTVTSWSASRQIGVLQREWRRRGIAFADSPRARLICVVVHNRLDHDELFVGHTGVLLPTTSGMWHREARLTGAQPSRALHPPP